MPRLFLFLFLGIGFADSAEVAFVVRRQPEGEMVRLEKDGLFYHTAIRYRGLWLHAHPRFGVILSSSLESMGKIAVVLVKPEVPEPTLEFVRSVWRLPFSFLSAWGDPASTNCSKLVAQILGVSPKPMTFDREIWGNRFDEFRGQLGLSPDELYRTLLGRHYELHSYRRGCLGLLAH